MFFFKIFPTFSSGKYCVQMSDDIHAFTFMEQSAEWHSKGLGLNEEGYKKPANLTAANGVGARATKRRLSAIGAARFIQYMMGQQNRSRESKAKLGGCYVNCNPGTSHMCPPIIEEHFVIGDFMVVHPSSSIKFDEVLTLKEDYDFTASHLHRFGAICRANRLLLHAEHYVNEVQRTLFFVV